VNISERIAPLNTHTFVEGGVLRLRQRIDVLDEYKNWLESFVVEETTDQVFNIFKSYIVC
jgi:hypothetical protein